MVDFYCPDEKLAVSPDATGHLTPESRDYDEIRDDFISGLGIKIIRYMNREVYHNLEAVPEVIKSNVRN